MRCMRVMRGVNARDVGVVGIRKCGNAIETGICTSCVLDSTLDGTDKYKIIAKKQLFMRFE